MYFNEIWSFKIYCKRKFAITGISMAVVLVILMSIGCSGKKISDAEFALVWQEYLKMEFEEGFDEKQSISQKEKIFKKLLSKYDFDLEDLKAYMIENHKDKYKKIFLE